MTRRYPLEPFMAVTGWTMAKMREQAPCNGSEYRLRISQGVTERIADRLAVAARLHPAQVWGDWFDAARIDCAAPDCMERFVPTRKGHTYCSKRCRERVGARRRYQDDPATRARRIENAARYYAEVGDYRRAQLRRRHWANRDAELKRMRDRYRAHTTTKENAA